MLLPLGSVAPCADAAGAVAGAGFGFFLTRTPLRDRLLSFLAGAAADGRDPFGGFSGGVACGVAAGGDLTTTREAMALEGW